jgi:hypothetical protein
MAMTIVATGAITGGVDTHRDVHVAAALDANRRRAGRGVVPDHHRRLPAAAQLARQARRRQGIDGRECHRDSDLGAIAVQLVAEGIQAWVRGVR